MSRTQIVWSLGLGLVVGCLTLPVAAQEKVSIDSKLPAYEPVEGVSGTLKSIGSDTMNNLMTLWGEGFKKHYPDVTIEVEGKGSSTAPPALIEGTAHFGPMSRPMKKEEIDDFEKKFGYKPTAIDTSIDMLAVFVNKDNPIKSLTLPQIDAIFSSGRKLGAAKDIKTWGDAGVTTGTFSKKPIGLNGRNSASGTYGYFKEHALGKGDFKANVKEHPGTSTVVQAVATDKFAIGYGGIGYLTADVKAVPISPDAKGKPVPAESKFGYSGEYPLSRFLIVYVNKKPDEPMDPLRREFIRYMMSRDGQEVVLKDGYLPITSQVAQRVLKAISLEETAASK